MAFKIQKSAGKCLIESSKYLGLGQFGICLQLFCLGFPKIGSQQLNLSYDVLI